MTLLRALSADWLKTKRTAIRLIMVIVPMVYPLVMLWYFTGQSSSSQIYDGYYTVMSVGMPVVAGTLCGLMALQEEHAGSFQGMLGSAMSRAAGYLSKFTLLLLMTTGCTFASTFILLAGMKWYLHTANLPVWRFVQGSLFLLLGSLMLYALHLLISFAFGMGASIASGGAGFIIAGIWGHTVAGDRVWPYVPWTWAVRLSQLPEVFLRDFKAPPGLNPQDFCTEQLDKVVGILIAGTLIVLIAGVAWFTRWEGRKSYE